MAGAKCSGKIKCHWVLPGVWIRGLPATSHMLLQVKSLEQAQGFCSEPVRDFVERKK